MVLPRAAPVKMSCSPSRPSPIEMRAADIAALDNEQLDQYLEQNRQPDGTRAVVVDDWENIPDDLLQRLRDRARKSSETVGALSVSVDPDQLAARLLQSSADQGSPRPRPRIVERSPTPPSRSNEEYEAELYMDLVAEGGRPLYPISLIGQVSKDAEQYREMLRPWLMCQDSDFPPNWTDIFLRQLGRWRDFRKWQLDNRRRPDKGDEYSAYVEMMTRLYHRDGAIYLLDELRADPDVLRPEWKSGLPLRELQRRTVRELHGEYSFLEYAEAMKRRLAQYNFTRPFQLMEDPTQQDTLTTWIEYLGFECWWHDHYVRLAESQQSKFNESWKRLVDSGVLRPRETPESIRKDESSWARVREEEHTEKALKSAKSAAERSLLPTVKFMKDPTAPNLPEHARKKLLATALETLNAAKKSLRMIRDRNERITDFIRGTWDYVGAKRDAKRQKCVIQWVLDQVPLIEAEANTEAATKSSVDQAASPSRKRGRECGDGENGLPKRRKHDGPEGLSTYLPFQKATGRSKRKLYGDAEESQRESKRSKTGSQATDTQTTKANSKPIRRSARIANIQPQCTAPASRVP
ncbi:hypothetical protein HIM_10084 [Hirsutella minnesotensis 3608]|uniref:Ankyrin 2,3/unc44 n=1 Tax=Hirsutella minnesotensis 3608 TaxID=1043627 RepID=A0A0F7ZKG6_9HYPO|nr:hypothetical protein HIM_10084 [Hirsutella minnesotensis 3608]